MIIIIDCFLNFHFMLANILKCLVKNNPMIVCTNWVVSKVLCIKVITPIYHSTLTWFFAVTRIFRADKSRWTRFLLCKNTMPVAIWTANWASIAIDVIFRAFKPWRSEPQAANSVTCNKVILHKEKIHQQLHEELMCFLQTIWSLSRLCI